MLERDGVIDKDAARTLDERVRDIEKALRDDDPEKVAEETDKLVEDYDKAVAGRCDPAGRRGRGSTRCSPTSRTPWTTSSPGSAYARALSRTSASANRQWPGE